MAYKKMEKSDHTFYSVCVRVTRDDVNIGAIFGGGVVQKIEGTVSPHLILL